MGFKFNALTGSLDIDTKTTDAQTIWGVDVSPATPTNNQIFRYDSSTTTWEIVDLDLSEYVKGPASSIDNSIARFDGTTGKLIQGYNANSPIIDDNGIASFPEDDFVQCERIGAGSIVSGIRAVAFGNLATAGQIGTAIGCFTAVSAGGTAIGYQAKAQVGTSGVAIGNNAQSNGGSGFALGANTRSTTFGVALGANAKAEGSGNSIAIGNGAVSNFISAAIGRTATATADYQVVLGGLFQVFDSFYYGCGASGLDSNRFNGDYEHYHGSPNEALADVAGKNVTWNATQGTGAGKGGDLIFKVAPASTTGTTRNALIEKFKISSEGETISSGAIRKPIATLTTNTTLNETYHTVLVDCTAGALSITLPSSTEGRIYNIKKKDETVNDVSIIGTVDGGTATKLTTQYESITVQSDGTNWWIL